MPTRRELLLRLAEPLEALYGAREARQIALVALSERTGCGISALLADPNAPAQVEELDRLIGELTAGRPLQYISGYTAFCGLRIGVREGVLIPRPETEELVQWIAGENPAARRILDVGTGSGCIALALKSLLPQAEVFGADISDEALAIARENAASLSLEVVFRQADALADETGCPDLFARNATDRPCQTPPALATAFPGSFDVIVSNPPYIPQAEAAEMRRNVIGYEPPMALFVPDNDPLRFYRAIARAAHRMLTPGGRLYYEIHERFGDEICDLLRAEGFAEITLHLDFNDKPRMVCCRKNA